MGKILTTIMDMYLNGPAGCLADAAERELELRGEVRRLFDALSEERRNLASSVRALEISKAECERVRTAGARLSDDLAESPCPKHVAELKKQVEFLRDELGEVQERGETLELLAKGREHTIEALQAELETARASEARMIGVNFDNCHEAEEASEEYDRKLETLRDELGAARAEGKTCEGAYEAGCEALSEQIETLRDELGAARAERDHALEQVTMSENGVFTVGGAGGVVHTSPDGGQTWTERQAEEPGYDELGAALTERDEAREAVDRLEGLLTEAVRERDEARGTAGFDELGRARTATNLAEDRIRGLEAELAHEKSEATTNWLDAEDIARSDIDEIRDLKNQIRELVDGDANTQGALLLARGGLVKAKELAKASEDAIKMFFALEPTSRDQQEWYPVRGELLGKLRKVVTMAEALRLTRS